MKLPKDIKLAPNFTFNEFLYSGDTETPSIEKSLNIAELAKVLQRLRNIVGSININSGFRGVAHNKSVGGSTDSYHLQGQAVDIRFDFTGWTRKSLTAVLKECGFVNVNFYWTPDRKSWVWIHADIGKSWDGSTFYVRDMDANTKKVISL